MICDEERLSIQTIRKADMTPRPRSGRSSGAAGRVRVRRRNWVRSPVFQTVRCSSAYVEDQAAREGETSAGREDVRTGTGQVPRNATWGLHEAGPMR